MENKWYVDEIYDAIIVKPLNQLGVIANKYFERSGIDAIVNGVGRLVNYGSRQMRWLQSGQVGSYVLLMVLSMVLFLVFQFFLYEECQVEIKIRGKATAFNKQSNCPIPSSFTEKLLPNVDIHAD